MTKPMGYLVVFFVPVSVILGAVLGGAWNFLTPVLVFGLVPVLDLAFGSNTKNPTPEEEAELLAAPIYKNIVLACGATQILMVAGGAWAFTHGDWTFLERVGFIFSMGSSSGIIGINVAHELTHRIHEKDGIEHRLGKAMLATVLYMHWAIEHVMGHHKNVATFDDPATARFGENFWKFLPRTVSGGFRDAWNMEAARLARKGLPAYGFENRVIRYLLIELAVLVFTGAVFGAAGLAYFVLQAAVAIWLLEVVNYIEHYGMKRKTLPDGSFETVKPIHSWNSSNWFTNYFLFNLERHSDHHFKPNRRYQILRHYEESPQLPTGYAGMILLAVIPPVWRKYMDGRVRLHRAANNMPE